MIATLKLSMLAVLGRIMAWGGKARLGMCPEAGHDAGTATNPDPYDGFLEYSLQGARTG